MKLKQTSAIGDWTAIIIVGGITITLIIGWIWNVVKLFSGAWDINGEFILRLIGVFVAPMGGVMGFL
jgi:hypothetical protein